MRETLTGLAIVLIVLLTVALAAPYFVDWNGQRAFVEARLSQALGEKVTIGGSIDLKLLPTPYLVLDQAVIGDDDGPITLGIRHLNLELAVTPLLRGAFEVVEARLLEPTIRLTLARDRTVPRLPDAPAFKADVRFDRIAIVDGTLAVADPSSGRTFAADHLDFEAEAASLAGPFKGSGSAGVGAARTKFRFATTMAPSGKARSRLVVVETPDHAGLDLDGIFALGGASDKKTSQGFDGTATVTGHLRDGDTILLPWRIAGPLHVDAMRVALGEGEFRLGGEDHNVLLAAQGEADLGDTPRLTVKLAGKQVDLDRLFGGGVDDNGTAVKPTLPDFETLRRALSGSPPPLPATVDLSLEAATYAGDTLANVQSTFTLATDRPTPIHLKGDGPGRSHLTLDGLWTPGATPAFKGTAAIAAGDMPAVVTWLGVVAPGLLPAGTEGGFRSIAAKGALDVAGGGFAARGLELRLDRSTLTGTAAYQPAGVSRAAAFQADLKADALDLDALPDLGRFRASTSGLDLDLRLDAHGIKVLRFADGPLNAGHISVALAKTGAHFAVSPLRIEGLGGATIEATAVLDPEGGRFDARVDADRLIDAAALARRLYPGVVSDGFAARAPALAPARLTVGATIKPRADGTLAPTTLRVAGALGGTKIEASLMPDPTRANAILAKADLAAPDAGPLLTQLGFPTLPIHNLGAGRVGLDASGPSDGPLASTVHGSFGGTTLDLGGQAILGADGLGGSGSLKLASVDVSPLLQALALAFPDLMGRIPLDATGRVTLTPIGLALEDLKGSVAGSAVTGSLAWQPSPKADQPALTGALNLYRLSLDTLLGLALGAPQPHPADKAWSALRFGTGLIEAPRSRLALRADVFDILPGFPGHQASLGLEVAHGVVSLDNISARVDGGQATGAVTLRRDGPSVAVEGTLGLAEAALDLPSVEGRLTARLAFAGSGLSASALVGSLAGTGDAKIGALDIPTADPAALSKVFEDIEGDRLTVDQESIGRALDEAAKAPLSLKSRRFTLSLAAGVLHVDPLKADAGAPDDDGGPVKSTLAASIDLRTVAIDERVEQTLQALPKDWAGPPPKIVTTLAGPLKTPVRATDISGFLNALATRALARESARIEAYEFDVHERAFFNQRLQADRRREQDRVKAEDDARLAIEAAARKLEAERRARDAAAKAERTRKAEEAARAQEERARAARDRAEQERANQDRANQDRANQDRANQDRIDQDRANRTPRGAPLPLSGATPEPASPLAPAPDR